MTENGCLAHQRIAIKDNICTIDFRTTCASNSLRSFQSPQDATVIQLLRAKGAIIESKTNMDEYGMGSHSSSSAFGSVRNLAADGEQYSPGGSSGGSALAVTQPNCFAWVEIHLAQLELLTYLLLARLVRTLVDPSGYPHVTLVFWDSSLLMA